MKKVLLLAAVIIGLVLFLIYDNAKESKPSAPITKPYETGMASFYSDQLQGRQTASGEEYDKDKLTAAHKTLPFGAMVRVTNVKDGKNIVVRINDRGPFVSDRVIDLSRIAATKIGLLEDGVTQVELERVE